jgi:hypothetical protein
LPHDGLSSIAFVASLIAYPYASVLVYACAKRHPVSHAISKGCENLQEATRGTNSSSVCPVCCLCVVKFDRFAVELDRLVPVVGGERLVAFGLEGRSLLRWCCHSGISVKEYFSMHESARRPVK